MPELKDQLANLKLIHDEVSARLGRLDANGARLDAKATTLLGFVLAVATFLAAQPGPVWWKASAFTAMAAAAVLGISAMRPRKHDDAPEPTPLWEYMRQREECATLAVLIAAKLKVFEKNHGIHETKATHWRYSLAALTLAVALTVTTLAIGSKHHGGSGSARLPVSTAPAK